MLKAIRDFFEANLSTPESPARRRHTLELATATLLAEVMRLEGTGAPEREAALEAVRRHFGLEEREAAELLALAEAEARDATDYYQFTSLIRGRYATADRIRIVEMLWQVAYADAALSAHELHVIRKVADLLYVPHSDYIAAKMRAQEAAGATPGGA